VSLGIVLGSVDGDLLGSIDGPSEWSTVGVSLGIVLGSLDGVLLGSIDGTSECRTVGVSLGIELGSLDGDLVGSGAKMGDRGVVGSGTGLGTANGTGKGTGAEIGEGIGIGAEPGAKMGDGGVAGCGTGKESGMGAGKGNEAGSVIIGDPGDKTGDGSSGKSVVGSSLIMTTGVAVLGGWPDVGSGSIGDPSDETGCALIGGVAGATAALGCGETVAIGNTLPLFKISTFLSSVVFTFALSCELGVIGDVSSLESSSSSSSDVSSTVVFLGESLGGIDGSRLPSGDTTASSEFMASNNPGGTS